MGAVTAAEPASIRLRSAAPGRVLLAVLCGQTMATLDGSIANVAAPAVRADLHASGAAVQLVVAGYLISFGVLVVTGARLGARHGPRAAFLAGLSLFVVSSLACGLAPTAWTLVAFRVVQGVGGALMVPQVVAVIHSEFEGDQRARAIGVYSLVLSLGVLAGQLLGGLLVSANVLGLGWRPVFLVNVPVGVFVFLLARRTLPHVRPRPGTRLDLGGVALLGLSLGALLVPLMLGRDLHWPTWTWPALGLGALGLVAFARYERGLGARGREALLDLAVLSNTALTAGGAAICTVMAAYAAVIFTVNLHLQDGLGYSALRAGTAMGCYAAGFGTVSLTWQRLPERLVQLVPVLGYAGFGAAALALAAVARGGWPPYALPLLTIAGCCHALAFSPLFNHVTTRLAPRHAPELSGLLSTGILLAEAAGIAVLGTVFFASPSTTTGLVRVLLILAAAMLPAALAAARALGMPCRSGRWLP